MGLTCVVLVGIGCASEKEIDMKKYLVSYTYQHKSWTGISSGFYEFEKITRDCICDVENTIKKDLDVDDVELLSFSPLDDTPSTSP